MKDKTKDERDCEHCIHHVMTEDGYYMCEKWICNYERKDTK